MTASPRWIPDDAELDAVARELGAREPSNERAEQIRTTVLAGAAAQRQAARRSATPFVVGGFAMAAAAAVVVWLVARPGDGDRSATVARGPKQIVTPIGVARFARASDWPDYVVRLDDGRIAIEVATVELGDRFRVATNDAEVEARDAKLEVGVAHDRLAAVLVRAGRAEVRVTGEPVVVVSAGESWSPTKIVQRDELVVPAPALPPPATHATTTSKRAPKIVAAPPPAATVEKSPAVVEQSPPPPALSAKPGEAEFRAGWAALRAGDASAAAKAFSTACAEAQHDALGEDACFWAGAAAKRAGDAATARTALTKFLAQFPSSSRAAEASALLGWLLYDAGDLDAAERMFHAAEHDRVPKVRDSAERGLAAIQRKRHAP